MEESGGHLRGPTSSVGDINGTITYHHISPEVDISVIPGYSIDNSTNDHLANEYCSSTSSQLIYLIKSGATSCALKGQRGVRGVSLIGIYCKRVGRREAHDKGIRMNCDDDLSQCIPQNDYPSS